MELQLRKILASVLVVLLMVNMLPAGLSQCLDSSTLAHAEAMEEAPSAGQSEQPDESDASGQTGGDQTAPEQPTATERPTIEPPTAPEQPAATELSTTPEPPAATEPSTTPEPPAATEQPATTQPAATEQPTTAEQPAATEQPNQFYEDESTAAPTDTVAILEQAESDIREKAAPVVTAVMIVATDDPDGTLPSPVIIPLNASASQQLNLTAKLTLTDPDAQAAVKWTSSRPKIVKVEYDAADSLECTVTGLTAGSATITCAAQDGSDKKATLKVTVARLVEDISVSGASQTVVAGFSVTLAAAVSPANATNKALEWGSDDTAVATVSAKGMVKGVTAGDVTITAKAKDSSGISGTYDIKVLPQVSGIQLTADGEETSAATIDVSSDKKSIVLKAQVEPLGAKEAVTFTTSSAKIAAISQNGMECTVAGGNVGTATITCTAADGSRKKTTFQVIVTRLAKEVTVKGPATEMITGASMTLTATVTPSNTTNKAVEWSSSDPAVATVSSKGVVKALVAGDVTITATATDGSGIFGTYDVVVNPAAGDVTVEVAGGAPAVIDLNDTDIQLQLTARIAPPEANQAVTWSSSNSKIAKVDKTGVVTGVAIGKATIKATAVDGSDMSGALQVSVVRLAKNVTVSGPAAMMIGGGSMALVATVTPTATTNRAVNWTTSDSAVATVSTKGVVTAKAVEHPETVTITATAKDGSGIFGTYAIMVNPAAAEVTVEAAGGGSAVIDLNDTVVKLQLTTKIAPTDANQAVTWSSSNSRIAKVDGAGMVTGVAVGKATITATAADGSDISGTLQVSVVRLAKDVTVDGPAATMIGGSSMSLTATVTPAVTTNKAVDWTTSDSAVATVSARGVVTAMAVEHPETVTITATAKDGSGASGAYDILVTPAANVVTVEAAGGAPAVIDLNGADVTLGLTARIAPADASQAVTWSTSNARIAKVDESGVVTGVAVGKATITATAADGSDISGTLQVTVTRLAGEVTISGPSTEMITGGKMTLTATVTPANTTNKAVTWTVEPAGVVTVSEIGMVTAIAEGAVTITATAKDGSGVSGSYIVTVNPAAVEVSIKTAGGASGRIDLNASDPEEKKLQLKAKVSPDRASQAVTWSSSNTSVGKVDGTGVVTGMAVGNATITATAADGSGAYGTFQISAVRLSNMVTVSAPAAEMITGTSMTLTAAVMPTNATNKAVDWATSDSAVATVSDKGVVTAIAAGTVMLTATAQDGSGAYGTFSIKVNSAAAAVTVETMDGGPAVIDLNEPVAANRTLKLTAKIAPDDASQAVTWSTSNARIAKVDSTTGVVTGVAVGIAIITATAADGSKASGTLQVTVTRLAHGIVVSGEQRLVEGQSTKLTAMVTPSNTTIKTVEWTSDPAGVVTVDSTGVVTALTLAVDELTPVTVIATATDGSELTGSLNMTVVPAVESVTIQAGGVNADKVFINLNSTVKTAPLAAVVNPADATQAVTWTSSNTRAAKVDPATGLVTGLAVGSAIITATATDGSGVTGTCNVTVAYGALSIQVSSGADELLSGETTTMTATVLPAATANKVVTWSVSDLSAASITGDVLTALSVSTKKVITVTATAADGSGVTGTKTVTILPRAASVSIQKGDADTSSQAIFLNAADLTLQLTAKVFPADARQGVTWSSNNNAVATVSSTGLVTALSEGTATITATAADGSGVKGTCIVNAISPVQSIQVSGADELLSGETASMAAVVLPGNATIKAVTWSVSDTGAASITSDGVLTALSVSVKKVVTVTATAADGSGVTGTKTVTILPRAASVLIQKGGADTSNESVILNSATTTLQLTAKVLPADARQGVTWSSSNAVALTVNNSGLVTAVAPGSATIIATTMDGSGVKGTCTVNAVYRVQSIQVSGVNELISGETANMSATVLPESATIKAVTWSVSDLSAASITSGGILTALSVSVKKVVTVTATASDGSGVTGTKTVTILPQPASVSIQRGGADVSTATVYLTSPTLQLTAPVSPADARQTVTWSSSNTAVATVDNTGLVTAVAAGLATITTTAAGTVISDTLALTVEASPTPLRILSIIADARLVEAGTVIRWTLGAQGYGNISFEAAVLKDGQPVGVAPVVSGSVVTFTPSSSGVYSLSAAAKNQYGEENSLMGGNVTACQVQLAQPTDTIRLGGLAASGPYASFAPDLALPSGTRIEYALSLKSGTAAALSISSQANSVCLIDYVEAATGSVQYELSYAAFDGAAQLFNGKRGLTCQVVLEDDLPTALAVNPGSYTGEAGTPITIPQGDLSLTSGVLLTKDFTWSIRDASGTVGQGLTIRYDEPGSHSLTVRGVYGGFQLECPVTVVVTKTILLGNDIRIGELHPDSAEDQYIGRAWVLNGAPLGEGQSYTWTLQRTGGSSVNLEIEDNGPGVDFAKLILRSYDDATADEQNDFTLTCKVNDLYKGELRFSITNKVEALTGMPTGVSYYKDPVIIPVGGTVTIDAATLEGEGAALPAGAWFDAFNVNWDVCTPNAYEGGFTVTFNQPGRYYITPAAGYQGYVWEASEILVIVGNGVSPAFDLTVNQRTKTIYMDVAAYERDFADAYAHDVVLLPGEEAHWAATYQGAGEPPVELSLWNDSDDYVHLDYENPRAEGEATFKLTYDAGPYHAEELLTVQVVAETPEGLPTGISYPVGKIVASPGEFLHFESGLIQFTGGTVEPEDAWFDFNVSSSLDSYGWWEGDRYSVEIPNTQNARYIVEAVAGFGNYRFTFPIEILVGDPGVALELRTYQSQDTVFNGGESDFPVARIFLSGLDRGDGEKCRWSVDRIDAGEDDLGTLYVKGDDESFGVSLSYSTGAGTGTGTASFRVTAEACGYTTSTVINLNVIAFDPSLLPSGIYTPYELTYALNVGGSLTVDPSLFRFATGTVPAGMTAWKDIDLWCIDPESVGGGVNEYRFDVPGRYILTCKIGIYNYSFARDIVVVVTDTGTLDPRLTFDQRFETIYPDGPEEGYVGEVRANDAVIRGDLDEDFEWTVEQSGDSGVATISIEDGGSSDSAWICYKQLGQTGTVRFRVGYKALGKLYEGQTEEYTLTVAPTPPNLPGEILLPKDRYEIHPGDSLDLYNTDIRYDKTLYSIPADANVKREYQPNMGDWDPVDTDWTDRGIHFTFYKVGCYTMDAILRVGNINVFHPITVLVGDSFPMDAKLTLDQKIDTVYLTGGTNGEYIGKVHVGAFEYTDFAEKYTWSITPLTENAKGIADIVVSNENSDVSDGRLRAYLGDQTGTVRYRVDYTGLDGLYAGSQEVSLSVEAAPPAGLPTSITYDGPAITVRPIGTVVLNPEDISVHGGEIPAEMETWNEFWLDRGDLENTYSEWDEGHILWSATFEDEGVYIVKAVLGVGNYVLTCDIPVRVMRGTALDAGLFFEGRYNDVWEDGIDDDFFGNVNSRDVVLPGDWDDFEWNIAPVSGGDVAEMYLNQEDARSSYVSVHYRLKGGTGTAVYKVTFTALGGTYWGECQVTLNVHTGGISGLPKGISFAPSSISLKPGETCTLDLGDISVNGSLPEGEYNIWRDFWTIQGDWDSVDIQRGDNTRTMTFNKPGRYLGWIVLGVNNYNWTVPVTITVLDTAQQVLDAGLHAYQYDGPKYLNNNLSTWVCDTYAESVALTDEEKLQAAWNIQQLEGQDVASLRGEMITWTYDYGWQVMCDLKDIPGHVKFKISYSALDGLYQGEKIVEFDVVDALTGVPTGITFPEDGIPNPVRPSEKMTLDLSRIQFVGGSFPDGAPVWYDFWTDGGDWGSVNLQWSENNPTRALTFRNEGMYTGTLRAGLGNYVYSLPVTFTVLEDGHTYVDAELNASLVYSTVYAGENQDDWLGNVEARNVWTLPEDQQRDATWKLTQDPGSTPDVAEIELRSSDDPTYTEIQYNLLGGTGHVKYKVEYSAADGLYRGMTYIEFDVVDRPENLPTGIRLRETNFTIGVDEPLELRTDNVEFTGLELWEGAPVWIRIWGDDGDWEDVDWDSDDEGNQTITFQTLGRRIVHYRAGVGSYFFDAQATIRVDVEDGDILDPGLRPDLRASVFYDQGPKEFWLGDVYAENVALTEDEKYAARWTVTQIGGPSGIAEVSHEDNEEEPNSQQLNCKLLGGVGNVRYRVDYWAADGLYQGSVEIAFTVRGTPSDMPTGISYNNETSLSINVKPGDTVELNLNDIQFMGGNIPEGDAGVWRRFMFDGNWDNVEEEDNDDGTIHKMTFRDEDRFILRMQMGLGNTEFSIPVTITVREDGHILDPDIRMDQRIRVAYFNGSDEVLYQVAAVWAEGAMLTEEERENDHWWIEKVYGDSDICEMALEAGEDSETGQWANVKLLGGLGSVKYALHYSAANGLYQGSIDLELTVKELPEGLPTGITYAHPNITVAPGGKVTLDMADVAFIGGVVPEDASIWREFWNYSGDWGSVWQNSGVGETRTDTYYNEGRYIVYARVIIGSIELRTPITIIVLEEGHDHLSAGLKKYQRFETAYVDGRQHDDWLSHIYAEGVFLSEEERQAADWQMTQLEGADVAEVSFYRLDWDSNGRGLDFTLKGVTGHVRCKVTYSAVDGLYRDEIFIDVDVLPGIIGLPNALSYTPAAFNILPGESISLNTNATQFIGGDVPDGAVIWREIWYKEGDWGSTQEEWNEDKTICTITFPTEGRYHLEMAAGIGNYFYEASVTITVLEEGQNYLDAGLRVHQPIRVMYRPDEYQDGWMGEVYADDVALTEEESEEANWTLTQTAGTGIARMTLEQVEGGGSPNEKWLVFELLEGYGHVEYTLNYSAADGLYQGSVDIGFDVEEVPAGLPDDISLPQTDFIIRPGGTVTIDKEDIQFISGTVPEGAPTWWSFDGDEGRWDRVPWTDEGTARTFTFYDVGRYTARVIFAIGNHRYMKPVTITVRDDDSQPLDPGLRMEQRYTTAYEGDTQEHTLGDVYADGVVLTEEEMEDADWTIVPVEGSDICQITIRVNQENLNSREFRLKLLGGTGHVKYRLDYSAADGLYEGSIYIELTVAASLGNLPTGVSYPDSSIQTQPGGKVIFDLNDIQFTGGELPANVEVWRQIWRDSGDWESVEEEWSDNDTVCTCTFNNEGRYVVYMAAGIGYYEFTTAVAITVLEEGQAYLDPGLWVNQQCATIYLNGETEDKIGGVYAEDVILLDGDDYHWSIEQTGDEGVVTTSIEDIEPDTVYIRYRMLGKTGTARFRVRFEAVNGLYQGVSDEFTLTVSPALYGTPEDLLLPKDHYDIRVGDTIHLYGSDIGYDHARYTIPEGASLFGEYWLADGDADAVVCDGHEDFTCTFNKPGEYRLQAVLSIGNIIVTHDIMVIVS